MTYNFDSTNTFLVSVRELDILVSLMNDASYGPLSKGAISLLCAKFQVFIESILNEFKKKLIDNKIKSGQLSDYMRNNSIVKAEYQNSQLLLKCLPDNIDLSNPSFQSKLDMLYEHLKFIKGKRLLVKKENFSFKTKFPQGKNGKRDLVNLLEQFDGESEDIIFGYYYDGIVKPDINKFSALIAVRNSILHTDNSSRLTKLDVEGYLQSTKVMVEYVDVYINQKYNNIVETII